MKRFLLISILGVLLVEGAFGQSGYKGKKHEVSFDLLNPFLQGMYQLEYKFSFHKNMSVMASYGLQDYENALIESSTIIGNKTFTGGHISSQGSMYGIGVAYNHPNAGMAMPVGYFIGITYQRIQNDLEDHFDEVDEPLVFNHKSNLVKFTYGRNFNIYKGLNLSLNINFGFYFGSTNPPENYSGNPINSDDVYPRELYPMAIPFLQGGRQIPGFLGMTLNSGYVKYYTMPRVQVGYMF